MMKAKTLLAVLALTVASACSTVPTKDIEIQTRADPRVNFSGYESYGLLAATGMIRDGEGRWAGPPFNIGQRVEYLIDQELGKRGIQKNSANPDLLVVYGIGVDMDNLDLKTDEKTDELHMENVPAGALIIALTDTQTGNVAWVAVASADIQENADEEMMQKRIDYAVSQMFKELPE